MPPSGLADIEIDLERGLARRQGRPIQLSAQEVLVLGVLVGAGGRVVGRSELQRRAGLSNRAPRRCDAVIVGLRRALGPSTIVTVRGRGWRCSGGLVGGRSSTPVPA